MWAISGLAVIVIAGVLVFVMMGGDNSEQALPDADIVQVTPAPTATQDPASEPQHQSRSTTPATPQPVLTNSVNQSDRVPVNTLAPRTQAVSRESANKQAATSAATSPSQPVTITPAGHYGGFHVKLSRTPWPLEGEKFGKPIPPTLLVDADTLAELDSIGSLQARPGQIIPWDQARRYVGQTITVQGKIVLTNRTSRVCFLNFTENWRGRFYVILFQDVLGSWPQSPDKYFLHKTIQVTGKVTERKGVPQIQVNKADQIKIIP